MAQVTAAAFSRSTTNSGQVDQRSSPGSKRGSQTVLSGNGSGALLSSNGSYYLVFALPESESSSTDANHEPFAVVRLDPLSGLPVHRRQQHRFATEYQALKAVSLESGSQDVSVLKKFEACLGLCSVGDVLLLLVAVETEAHSLPNEEQVFAVERAQWLKVRLSNGRGMTQAQAEGVDALIKFPLCNVCFYSFTCDLSSRFPFGPQTSVPANTDHWWNKWLSAPLRQVGLSIACPPLHRGLVRSCRGTDGLSFLVISRHSSQSSGACFSNAGLIANDAVANESQCELVAWGKATDKKEASWCSYVWYKGTVPAQYDLLPAFDVQRDIKSAVQRDSVAPTVFRAQFPAEDVWLNVSQGSRLHEEVITRRRIRSNSMRSNASLSVPPSPGPPTLGDAEGTEIFGGRHSMSLLRSLSGFSRNPSDLELLSEQASSDHLSGGSQTANALLLETEESVTPFPALATRFHTVTDLVSLEDLVSESLCECAANPNLIVYNWAEVHDVLGVDDCSLGLWNALSATYSGMGLTTGSILLREGRSPRVYCEEQQRGVLRVVSEDGLMHVASSSFFAILQVLAEAIKKCQSSPEGSQPWRLLKCRLVEVEDNIDAEALSLLAKFCTDDFALSSGDYTPDITVVTELHARITALSQSNKLTPPRPKHRDGRWQDSIKADNSYLTPLERLARTREFERQERLFLGAEPRFVSSCSSAIGTSQTTPSSLLSYIPATVSNPENTLFSLTQPHKLVVESHDFSCDLHLGSICRISRLIITAPAPSHGRVTMSVYVGESQSALGIIIKDMNLPSSLAHSSLEIDVEAFVQLSRWSWLDRSHFSVPSCRFARVEFHTTADKLVVPSFQIYGVSGDPLPEDEVSVAAQLAESVCQRLDASIANTRSIENPSTNSACEEVRQHLAKMVEKEWSVGDALDVEILRRKYALSEKEMDEIATDTGINPLQWAHRVHRLPPPLPPSLRKVAPQPCSKCSAVSPPHLCHECWHLFCELCMEEEPRVLAHVGVQSGRVCQGCAPKVDQLTLKYERLSALPVFGMQATAKPLPKVAAGSTTFDDDLVCTPFATATLTTEDGRCISGGDIVMAHPADFPLAHTLQNVQGDLTLRIQVPTKMEFHGFRLIGGEEDSDQALQIQAKVGSSFEDLHDVVTSNTTLDKAFARVEEQFPAASGRVMVVTIRRNHGTPASLARFYPLGRHIAPPFEPSPALNAGNRRRRSSSQSRCYNGILQGGRYVQLERSQPALWRGISCYFKGWSCNAQLQVWAQMQTGPQHIGTYWLPSAMPSCTLQFLFGEAVECQKLTIAVERQGASWAWPEFSFVS